MKLNCIRYKIVLQYKHPFYFDKYIKIEVYLEIDQITEGNSEIILFYLHHLICISAVNCQYFCWLYAGH